MCAAEEIAQHSRQSRYFIRHLPPGSLACCGRGASASPKLWAVILPSLPSWFLSSQPERRESPGAVVVSLGCILGVLLKGNGGFVWGNGFVWPWLHNAAAKREHWVALRVLRHGKSHQQLSAGFSGASVQSPCHTHKNRHGKSNFRHCTRQQRATESLSSFLARNLSAPALSSTNADPAGMLSL